MIKRVLIAVSILLTPALPRAVAQPPSYDDLIARSKSALTAKNYAEALAASNDAIRMNSQRWEPYVLAGSAYSSLGRFEEAVTSLQSALVRAPEERKPLIREALAGIHGRIDKPDAPVAELPAPTTQPRVAVHESASTLSRTESSSTIAAPVEPPNPDIHYHPGPDSLAEDGVPKGEVRGPFTLPSTAYPGTSHTYWVYVPAQYDPAIPASLMIFNDGQAFKNAEGDLRAQNVMDNLIYRHEIPVMIGVFINPGRRPDQPESTPKEWGDKTNNRPTEYNTLDNRYARVVCDELLPALYKDFNISKNPDEHGIGGASSGAIAAFTVSWERPDQFHKVLSIVGSFTNIRGGDAYPDIVRNSPKKPIRVFLQDGRNDNRSLKSDGTYDPRRDWFLQNVRMEQALTEKGYDVNYAWGMNRHGQKMGAEILPEMMRWLWRDHPVSTDPRDMRERGFLEPAASRAEPAKKE